MKADGAASSAPAIGHGIGMFARGLGSDLSYSSLCAFRQRETRIGLLVRQGRRDEGHFAGRGDVIITI